VLHANPRILILDDLPEKGRLLSRILISKDYSANSLTYPQNGLDEIEKERPDLLILDLNFSEASIIGILQKIRENNPSLPIFICYDSVTEQFKNQVLWIQTSDCPIGCLCLFSKSGCGQTTTGLGGTNIRSDERNYRRTMRREGLATPRMPQIRERR
jgi:CheY-like chemotaxis protein